MTVLKEYKVHPDKEAKEFRVLLDWVSKEIKAYRDQSDHKELLVYKVQLVPLVCREFKAFKVSVDLLVGWVQQDMMDAEEYKASSVRRESREQLEIKVYKDQLVPKEYKE